MICECELLINSDAEASYYRKKIDDWTVGNKNRAVNFSKLILCAETSELCLLSIQFRSVGRHPEADIVDIRDQACKRCFTVVGRCMKDTDAVTCSDDQHISGVQQEQDWSKYIALRHNVLDCKARPVLASYKDGTNPLCTTSDDAGNPWQNIITKAKSMIESVDHDILIRVKSSV